MGGTGIQLRCANIARLKNQSLVHIAEITIM
jgi:hypothetical protein